MLFILMKIFKCFIFFLFIESFGLILVNKITQVLGAQFYNILIVHCCVFSTPSQVSVQHHLLPYTLFHCPPLTVTTLLSVPMKFFSFYFFLAQSLHPTAPPHSCQPALYESLFYLLVHFVH